MSELYLKWMDRLYLLAMAIAGLSLLVMTIVIPIGIFSRYVLNRGVDVHLYRRGGELPRRIAHCGEHAHRQIARLPENGLRTGGGSADAGHLRHHVLVQLPAVH